MKGQPHNGCRAERIVAAIALGINTSKKLAAAFDSTVANISPELNRLEGMGAIFRGATAPTTKRGRACVRWRATREVNRAPPSCGVEDCRGPAYSRGLCHVHYQRQRRAGRRAAPAVAGPA